VRWVAFLAVACLAGSGCLTVAGLSPAPGPALHEALLWSSLYPELVVEVGAVPGREPDRAALVALGRALVELTGRDEGNVSVLEPVAIPAQGGDYKPSDLPRIHRRTAAYIEPSQVVVGGTATLHVLFLDGAMRHDERQRMVLGTTIAADGLIVVFPDAYAAAVRHTPSGQTLSARAEMDRHVLLHELGHAFGLVGQRIPMVRPHADPDHPGHSANPLSILHHQPPMTLAGMVYGEGPRDFDGDDRADLAAFQAKAPRPVLAH
jgi:hypothetical protein